MRYLIRGEWVECSSHQDWRNKICQKDNATVFDVQVVRGHAEIVKHIFGSYDWPATTEWLTNMFSNWPTQLETSEAACIAWAKHIQELYPTSFFEHLEELRKLQNSFIRAKLERNDVAGRMIKKLEKLHKELTKQRTRKLRARRRR